MSINVEIKNQMIELRCEIAEGYYQIVEILVNGWISLFFVVFSFYEFYRVLINAPVQGPVEWMIRSWMIVTGILFYISLMVKLFVWLYTRKLKKGVIT